MSFREKSAWVTLIAILIVATMYFLHVPSVLDPDPGEWAMHMVALSFAAFIVIEIVAHLVLYFRNWKEARTPKDERERLIELRATRLAAYVYAIGSLIVVALAPIHGASAFGVAVFVLLAFVIAEVVNYAARIVYYRRGF